MGSRNDFRVRSVGSENGLSVKGRVRGGLARGRKRAEPVGCPAEGLGLLRTIGAVRANIDEVAVVQDRGGVPVMNAKGVSAGGLILAARDQRALRGSRESGARHDISRVDRPFTCAAGKVEGPAGAGRGRRRSRPGGARGVGLLEYSSGIWRVLGIGGDVPTGARGGGFGSGNKKY